MNISRADLATARETTGRLLDALGIEAYLYELEPGDGVYELRVECAVSEGWENFTWSVPVDELRVTDADAFLRERLLKIWSDKLRACRRRPT